MSLARRVHMHSFIASAHMRFPTHQHVFFNPNLHFLFQDKIHMLRSCGLTHSQMWRGQACYQENQERQINEYVLKMDLGSFSFHYAPWGRIKIQLLFAFWEPAVHRAVKATSSIAFPKALSARQMVDQERKNSHAGSQFWSWEESESSSTGLLTDLPTCLRCWPRQGWHSKKRCSWCLPEPPVLTN